MSNIRRNTRSRRANIRLARTLVVLSLATVFGAGFAMQAGAGSKVVPAKPDSYVVVTVAPGETLWSVAKALNDGGDVRQLVDEIWSRSVIERLTRRHDEITKRKTSWKIEQVRLCLEGKFPLRYRVVS